MIGAIQSLEALRSCQIGTAMMAAFIRFELEEQPNIQSTLDTVKTMNDIGKLLIIALAPFQFWSTGAFRDYCTGVD